MKFTTNSLLISAAISAVLAGSIAPAVAAETETGLNTESARNLTIFFTRHAEKQTITNVTGEGAASTYTSVYAQEGGVEFPVSGGVSQDSGDTLDEICGDGKCAEELSALGEVRAMLLADWFGRKGQLNKIGAVYATHKLRTQQTVMPTATAAGLDVTILNPQFSELAPASTSPSECATLEAIVAERASAENNTIVVAGHSGTLYDIMGSGVSNCGDLTGLGLDTGNTVAGTGDADFFPKDDSGKVRDFGDIWKIVIKRSGEIQLRYRLNLQQPAYLETATKAINTF